MSEQKVFDIKALLLKEKDIFDISDILFLEVIPLVTKAMFTCYPALETPSVMEFSTELNSRIDGWYVWTKHTLYRGILRKIAVRLIQEEYGRILACMGITTIFK